MQQSRTQIGQDVPTTLGWSRRGAEPDSRRNRIQDLEARSLCPDLCRAEFYKDAVLAIFASMLSSTFQPLGWDMKHSFMVHADQAVGKDMNPGFYFAEYSLYHRRGL